MPSSRSGTPTSVSIPGTSEPVTTVQAWRIAARVHTLPAAVVPVGFSSEGLPIGVQVIGRPHEEEVVLAIAERIEQWSGGWRKPPLA